MPVLKIKKRTKPGPGVRNAKKKESLNVIYSVIKCNRIILPQIRKIFTDFHRNRRESVKIFFNVKTSFELEKVPD